MTWGKDIEFLSKWEENGLPGPPQALRDRPQLEPQQAYYKKVFREVSGGRGYSMSGTPLPIPVSEVLSYFDMFYIREPWERDLLFSMVQTLDGVYLTEAAAKAKAEADKNK